MSVFDSRCAAVGPTLGIRFNGEPVEVAYTDGTRLSSTAIIEQEEPIRDTEMSRPTIRQAKVHFLATERNRLFPDKRRPTKLLAQEQNGTSLMFLSARRWNVRSFCTG